jgi:hypothetical protein
MSLPGCCSTSSYAPSSSEKVIIIPAEPSSPCIGSIHYAYSTEFPVQLDNYMSRDEFDQIMESVNDTLHMFWPCGLCTTFAWVCCLPTVGLACCGPRICMHQAETEIKAKLARANKRSIQSGNFVRWSFEKSCFTSWVI